MRLPDEDWQQGDGYKEAAYTFGEATLRLQVTHEEYGSLILSLPDRQVFSTSGPVAELPQRGWGKIITDGSLHQKDWLKYVVSKLSQWDNHFNDMEGDTDE